MSKTQSKIHQKHKVKYIKNTKQNTSKTQSKTPRLIDEWQVAPVLWDAVRNAVDERRERGQFILTGSTVIEDSEIMHTGTGRILRMSMYPMSLYESLEADAVLHLDDGRYALIECKLGSRDIEEGAKHLLTLKSLVQKYNETSEQIKLREPDLLIVITGGEIAYTRNDGVKVVPLACLRD
jgi:predicted AAA+ superfamily ATPase